MKNIVTLASVAFGMVLMCGPAFAGVGIILVPEPISLSLLAGGVVAIAAVKRIRDK